MASLETSVNLMPGMSFGCVRKTHYLEGTSGKNMLT